MTLPLRTSPPGTPSTAAVSRRTVLASLLGAALSACGGGGGTPDSPEGGAQYGGLRVRGQEIVDLGGNAVTLRGINWGRWGMVQAQDAADNAAQGANCVRIPLRWWGLYAGNGIDSRDDSAPGLIDPDNLAILDQMVGWAEAAGLWILLFVDSNCGQDGTQTGQPGYCDPKSQYPDGNNFWTDPAQRADFIQVWQFVADRYKGVSTLGLFEPLPEPDPQSASDADINAFYVQLTSAIRAVAPGVPFVVGARSYDITSVGEAYDAAWSDVVYTGDLFLHTGGTEQQNLQDLSTRLQDLVDLRTARNVPVFVQQAGVQSGDDPDQVYQNAMLSLLTQNDVGFTWWEYRDGEVSDGYGVLYQDDNGNWQTKTAVLTTLESYYAA